MKKGRTVDSANDSERPIQNQRGEFNSSAPRATTKPRKKKIRAASTKLENENMVRKHDDVSSSSSTTGAVAPRQAETSRKDIADLETSVISKTKRRSTNKSRARAETRKEQYKAASNKTSTVENAFLPSSINRTDGPSTEKARTNSSAQVKANAKSSKEQRKAGAKIDQPDKKATPPNEFSRSDESEKKSKKTSSSPDKKEKRFRSRRLLSKNRSAEDEETVPPPTTSLKNGVASTVPGAVGVVTSLASRNREGSSIQLEEAQDSNQYVGSVLATPIEAELVPSEDAIAARLKVQMEEQLERQVEERLKKERQHAVVVEAIEVDPNSKKDTFLAQEENPFLGISRRNWYIVMALCTVGIVVGIVVALTGDNSSGNPTAAPTISTTPAFDSLLDQIGPSISDDFSFFGDTSTSQYQALEWLANHDGLLNLHGEDVPITVDDSILIERYAAAVFYYATEGPRWRNRLSFLSNSSVCEWQGGGFSGSGIDCANGSVTDLYFYDEGLRGSLPTEIGLFTNLANLVLDANRISGTIPREIFQLKNLQVLSAASSDFDGMLSTEIGELTNLLVLDISNNNFHGEIPTEIGFLTDLESLNAFDNSFVGGIPSQIGLLTNLRTLNIQENRLDGKIPSEIGRLILLHQLSLGSNGLTGSLPSQIGYLTFLIEFSVYQNNLSGTIPTEFANLLDLYLVELHQNELSGDLDPAFCDGRDQNLFDDDTFFDDDSFSDDAIVIDIGLEDFVPGFFLDIYSDCDSEVECSCCLCCDNDGFCGFPADYNYTFFDDDYGTGFP